MKDEAAVW